MNPIKKIQFLLLYGTLFLILFLSIIISITIGPFKIPLVSIMKSSECIFIDRSLCNIPNAFLITIYEIRLPRILLSVCVGMALSASGVSLQAIFRNPLVDPFVLGISAGAAMGSALSLAFFPEIPVQISSFIFGLIAVFLAIFVASTRHELPIISLILSGIVISSLFTALLSGIQFLVDPDRLGSIIFWLMGSFGRVDSKTALTITSLIIFGLVLLYSLSWKLNIMSLGNEEAKSLGIETGKLRLLIIIIASFLTAISVSACGVIGWVGLIIPHMARMIIGPEHRRLTLLTIILGGIFMLWVDNLSRALTDFEIPVGIITSFCGAPFFMFLLKKGQKNWIP